MGDETKWNKKIDFEPRLPSMRDGQVREGLEGGEPSDSILDDQEMVQKLNDMRNKKKGFTKLPALDSIYDVITGSEQATEPEQATDPEPVVEGFKQSQTAKNYHYTMRYCANLTYNVAFDVFAYVVFQITTGSQPKYPGKERPTNPSEGAKYDESKAAYDDCCAKIRNLACDI